MPLFLERFRSRWQPALAFTIAVVFMLVHITVFLPLKRRLTVAQSKAHSLGVAFDPDSPPDMMPPRVVALVAGNTLTPDQAQARGSSGALTADLFDAVTTAANQSGVSILATEPGVVVPLENSVQVKAHVSATCTYNQFLHMLDALARGDQLIAVERFSLVQTGGSRLQLELWLSRLILKRSHS